MNKKERNKARKFYMDSNVIGIHTDKTDTIELSYSDMLKLMNDYAKYNFDTNKKSFLNKFIDWYNENRRSYEIPEHDDVDEFLDFEANITIKKNDT